MNIVVVWLDIVFRQECWNCSGFAYLYFLVSFNPIVVLFMAVG